MKFSNIRNKIKYIIVIFVIIFMFRGVQILMFESGIGLCEDVVMMSKKSPDGKLTASIVERNCGATTDYVYFACLRPTIVGRIFGDGVKIVNGKGVSHGSLIF